MAQMADVSMSLSYIRYTPTRYLSVPKSFRTES